MIWEWLLRRKVRKAQRRYEQRVAQNGPEWHEARASCHEQGRGHLACNGKHI